MDKTGKWPLFLPFLPLQELFCRLITFSPTSSARQLHSWPTPLEAAKAHPGSACRHRSEGQLEQEQTCSRQSTGVPNTFLTGTIILISSSIKAPVESIGSQASCQIPRASSSSSALSPKLLLLAGKQKCHPHLSWPLLKRSIWFAMSDLVRNKEHRNNNNHSEHLNGIK